ncbi:hypothetical protein V8B97DRAFT_1331107 [Scleroderma yunnanense]
MSSQPAETQPSAGNTIAVPTQGPITLPEQPQVQPTPRLQNIEHAIMNTTPRRDATGPDLGSEIPADQIYRPEEVNRDDPNIHIIELPPQKKLSFKEQMHGERVLRGEETIPSRRGSTLE